MLLDMGLNSAVNRYIPVYLIEKDHKSISRVVNTTLVVYALASSVILLVTAILVYGFPSWFQVPPELASTSRWTVAIVGLGFAIPMMLNVFGAVLSGLQRYDLIAFSDVSGRMLFCLGAFGSLANGLGLLSVAIVASGSRVFRGLCRTFLALKNYPQFRIQPKLAGWSTFTSMFGYSANTLLFSSGQFLQQQSALLLVGAFFGAAGVPEYALPLIPANFCAQLILLGTAAIKPAASQLDAEGKHEHVKLLFTRGMKYALMIFLPMLYLVVGFGPEVMSVWLDRVLITNSSQILVILFVSESFRAWNVPGYYVAAGLGKHRLFGISTVATAVASCILGSIFGFALGWGTRGVAVGFALPSIIASSFVIMPYVCRTVGLSIRKALRLSVLPAMKSTAPLLLTMAVTVRYYLPSTLTELLILIALFSIPTLAGWWLLGLDRNERTLFMGFVSARKILARFRR
jgi:O-antigen/teichoic acid export membrane protein